MASGFNIQGSHAKCYSQIPVADPGEPYESLTHIIGRILGPLRDLQGFPRGIDNGSCTGSIRVPTGSTEEGIRGMRFHSLA